MKRLLLTCIVITFHVFSYSQINCSPIPAGGCNSITNHDFNHPNYNPYDWYHYTDPFTMNLVPGWLSSHGTPTIYDGVFFNTPLPPTGASGYFFAGVGQDGVQGGNGAFFSEGVAQKIPTLVPGHLYAFSFFKAKKDYTSNPYVQTNNPVDFLHIRLMNCSDYDTYFHPPSHAYPTIPPNSQAIYCETAVANDNWEQVMIYFTATTAYDMIWIYPEEYQIPWRFSGLFFSHPQLIDITAIQSQVQQGTYPNCMATLPNCGPLNSTYIWEGPNGQYITAQSGQTVQVNASNPLNVGTWFLTIVLPGATITNNTCSQQGGVFTSVNVTACSSPPPGGEVWTWVNGDNIVNQPAVYGTQGVPSPANKPGGRFSAMSWTDPNGNLWLFGGMPNAGVPNTCYNDLWKYDPVSNEWTWKTGSNISNQPAVYGTMGVPGAANTPGARTLGITWVDLSGNLWLYGGQGYSMANSTLGDLWKYDISINQWTWVNGSQLSFQPPNHGTVLVPAPSNYPGCRVFSVSWADLSGDLWLHGGDDGITGPKDDLWRYNIASNMWTWMKGSTGAGNPVYGTKGVSNKFTKPGWRVYAVSWTDASNNLWMFGGLGPDVNTSIGELNDLWRYNIGTRNWTWMSGDNIINQAGVYGIKGTASPANKPGARDWAISWADNSKNNLFLFGGQKNGVFNDLWKYNTGTNQWTWVSGDNVVNTPGVYGTLGTGTTSTKPGARTASISFRDPNNGTLWLFGGYGYGNTAQPGRLNDLWKYNDATTGQCCSYKNGSIDQNSTHPSFANGVTGNASKELSKFRAGEKVNIESISIYNTAGQLVKTSSSIQEIAEIIVAGKAPGFLTRNIYFIKIIYKNKTTEMIKKILQ